MPRVLAAVVLLLAISAGAQTPGELAGRVVGIADGDTLTLLVDQSPVRIRLAQIDAPESGQPYGRAAKQALSDLAFGKAARVEVVDTDRYGRKVGELFVDRLHVNAEMVRRGHAWAYTEYSPSLEIVDLENEARAAKRGLWALQPDQREPPWLWRRRERGEGGREPAAPVPGPLVCGGPRTCKQMATCEEARFHLERCGLTSLDGDGDGVPCERLCGSRR